MRKMLVRASRRSIARPDRMARRTSASLWWQRRKPRRRGLPYNRDKLIEMFNSVAGSASRPDGSGQPRAQGDLPGSLSSILGGAGVGGLLGGGLSELLEQ